MREFVGEEDVQLKGECSDPEWSLDHLEPGSEWARTVTSTPQAFWHRCAGPPKRALCGGWRGRPGLFFFLFQHGSLYLLRVKQPTLWTTVSWVDPMVKVRGTACQVESKSPILDMHLLLSFLFFGDINKNTYLLVGRYLLISISPCSWSFSSGLYFSGTMDMSLSKLWEIVRDREACRGAVRGVTQSQTRLSDWRMTRHAPKSVGLAHSWAVGNVVINSPSLVRPLVP